MSANSKVKIGKLIEVHTGNLISVN